MDKLFDVDWEAMFTPASSILEMILRGTLTYFFCFMYLRFFRRGAAQAGITDLLLITLIADAAQNSMSGDYKSITEGITLVGTLVFWDYFLDYLGFKSTLFRKFNSPSPLLLVKDGQMVKNNLRKEFLSEDELRGMLREQGVEDLSKVKSCHLEGSGNMSVIKMEE